MFELHPQLDKDCHVVGDLSLCRVLLCDDSSYPWIILVPRRQNIREAYELTDADQRQLMTESNQCSRLLSELFHAEKMNVAALGNMVPQLHLHHIVRYQTDAAWPGPIWGHACAQKYQSDQLAIRIADLRQLFSEINLVVP
jgi:diadenosine tetraphosphate (Ap4A) HIT family hydrolase